MFGRGSGRVRGEELDELLVLETAADELPAGHPPVGVDVHALEDALGPGLGALELVHGDLVGAHHVVDRLDDLGHLDQVNMSVAVDIVHAERER